MGIMLGNLSVSDIERRLSIKFNDEDRKFLSENRQEKINDTPLSCGKWHCFDIPFLLLCDSPETLKKVHEIFKKYDLKGCIKVGVQ